MRRICITTLLILLCFNQLLAPSLSRYQEEQKVKNTMLILKLNDILKLKYNYYPKVDTSQIHFDINYMQTSIHRMLLTEAMCQQEVGLSISEYNQLTVKQLVDERKAWNPGEQAAGILQMRPIMYRHLTKVLRLCNYGINDRWKADKSIQMFIVFQNYYNPEWDLEKGSRDWNGGGDLGINKTTTLKYYKEVKEKYNVLVEKFLI